MTKKIGKIIIGMCLLFGLGIGAALVFENIDVPKIFENIGGDDNSPTSEPEEIEKQDIPQPNSISVSTLFFGDVYFGRYIDDWSKASDLGYAYPFSGLDTFNRGEYDAWIANLECPVTTTYRSAAKQNANLMFSCLPEYIPEARKWFDVFSLANNHTDNMEHVEGFKQTKNYLEENNFQYFGHYQNSNSEEVCEVVSLTKTAGYGSKPEIDDDEELVDDESGEANLNESKVKEYAGINIRKEWFEKQEDYQLYSELTELSDEEIAEGYEGDFIRNFHIPIALCGYNGVFELPTDENIAVIEKYAKYLPTFIMPHQGVEYKFQANSYQKNIYRKMIDLGADGVIGGHTHTVQNTEVYNDKLIVYSLGNFIFDQQTKYKTQGMGLGMKLTFQYDDNLVEWLKISEDCIAAEDDCLAQAEAMALTKPVFTIDYEAFGTDNSSHVVQRASTEIESIILEKANWATTLEEISKISDQ